MAENQVKIVISAEDKASSTMSKVAQSFKQYQSSYESIGQFTARQKAEADSLAASHRNLADATGSVSASNKGLFTTFTAATLAAEGISRAFEFVKGQIGESIQAARDYDSAMTGLAAATASYGMSADTAKNQALSLSSDGILPITDSAKALQNLMAGGLGLEQSTELIQTFMDRAAFGRNRTIDFGTAIENLTQAFRTEQSELSDASGMTENYSQILEIGANQLGKNVESLTAAERAQAKFLGIQQLSTAQAGNYARYLETDAAAQDRFNYTIEETQRKLGMALQPAVALAQTGFGSLIESLGITDANMKNVQGSIVTLVAVAQMAGNLILGVGQTIIGMFQSIFTLSLDPFEKAAQASADRIIDTSVNWQRSIEKIATGTADTQIDESKRAVSGIADATNKATRTMMRDIDDANRTFARSQEQRLAQFEESVRDMVIAHRDKALSIKSDLAEEDAAYAQSAIKRTKAYEEDIEDLEERHAEKVKDITKEITDERNSGLVVDGVLYRQANQEKLDELQAELDEEVAKHTEALNERKTQYAEDVAEDQARHDAKRTQLQTELTSELEIMNRHRSEVAAVGNAQKQDDITRLKAQFAEANAEATRNHQEQIIKIRARGAEQGAAGGSSLAAGLGQAFNSSQGALTNQSRDMGVGIGRGISDGIRQGFAPDPNTFLGKLINNFGAIQQNPGQVFGELFKGIGEFFSKDSKVGWMASLMGRAGGGIIQPGETTLVGERGPEIIQAPGGSRVFTSSQTQQMLSGNGGVTIQNLNITNNTRTDHAAMLSDIGWAISRKVSP